MIVALLPPLWLIHVAVAAVWFYEGLWCKLLNGQPRQLRVVEAMPLYRSAYCTELLKLLGARGDGDRSLDLNRNRSHCLRSRTNCAACNAKPLRSAMGPPIN